MAKKKTLPKIIHVTIYSNGHDEPYLNASASGIEEFDDGVQVGTYELVSIKTKKVEHSLKG